jgi:hypothetical protein
MVRLKDIAAQAGVSVMTVSKVMRDASDISAATKARVRALAESMGYMPDSVAQGLRNRTTKLFGLVISAITNPIFARVVMAIEEQAFEMGYDVIVAHSLNVPEREQAVIRRLISRRVDGLFIVPVYRLARTAPVYEELSRRGTPTVLLGHRAPFCDKFVSVKPMISVPATARHDIFWTLDTSASPSSRARPPRHPRRSALKVTAGLFVKRTWRLKTSSFFKRARRSKKARKPRCKC